MTTATAAFIVLALSVGSVVSGCSAMSKSDQEASTVRTRVAEHDVYYLEIVTPDIESASRFYADAFGWKFMPIAPELGNARVAYLPGGAMCGIRAPIGLNEQPVVRTYFRVTDVDAAAKNAAQLGATIALEPTDIPGRGRIAIYFIGGIEQGIWQAQ